MSDETFETKSVLFCVPVDEVCMNLLKCHGIQADTKLNVCDKKLCDMVRDYHAVIASSNTKLSAEIFKAGTENGGKLCAVGRACGGVDNIDVAAAGRCGVVVLNPPSKCSITAFGLSCLLIRALSPPITPVGENQKDARWDQKLYCGILDIANTSQEVTANIKSWAMRSIGHHATAKGEARTVGIAAGDLSKHWNTAERTVIHMPFI